MALDFKGIISIKKYDQAIFKNEFCKPKGETTSCKKTVTSGIYYKQEGDK